jgi:hypothetical protein
MMNARELEVLRDLLGEGPLDITQENVSQALKQLKEEDPVRGELRARRIQRALDGLLKKKVFRRRKLKLEQTTAGTKARVALLPENPHLYSDVEEIRRALGIPDDHIHVKKTSHRSPPLGHLDPSRLIRLEEGELASRWMWVHRQAHLGLPISMGDDGTLPEEMWESAKANCRVPLDRIDVPEWLRRPPAGPEPYSENGAPFDRAIGRLMERYGLPWHLSSPLSFYVLTRDLDRITDMEWMPVSVTYEESSALRDPDAFSLHIFGLDEFVTKEDWDRVWNRYVRPRQELLWEERGSRPRTVRGFSLKVLRQFLPSYGRKVNLGFTIRQLHAETLMEKDQETIRRSMRILEKLLAPLDEMTPPGDEEAAPDRA